MYKTWLNKFKLALVEEDIEGLERLLDELDYKALATNLANDKEVLNETLHQIRALMQEAIELINSKKDKKAIEIQKFKKALTYLKA